MRTPSKFYGPVRLREALVHSRNLVSVRLMRAIGGDYARNYVTRFGFDKSQLPDDLTLALGTAELSPLQVAIGYSTFANGGFKVSSYYIDRVEDAAGKVLQQANPAIACPQCGRASDAACRQGRARRHGRSCWTRPRTTARPLIPAKNLAPQIIRPQIAYLLADMMADVIRRGTGQRARTLNRDDIAGKTGTTSDFHDAWFNGFNGDIVTTVWTGFDQDRSLGEGRARRRTSRCRPGPTSCTRRWRAPPGMACPCRTASSACASRRRPDCSRAPTIPTASWKNSSRGICPSPNCTKGRTRTTRNAR